MIRFRDAINALVKEKHPDCGWGYIGDIDDLKDLIGLSIGNDETAKFTYDDVLVKKKELEKQYADNEYQRKRLEEYNAIGIGEQLDMIYHDMDGWKARIKSVKDKYPKPSE